MNMNSEAILNLNEGTIEVPAKTARWAVRVFDREGWRQMNCPRCHKPIDIASIAREDLLSLRGQINSALRITRASGSKPTCDCKTCKTCRKREAMRRYRAK